MMAAQNLTRLTKLDFTNQYLSGTVPANVSFPWLEELVMVSNNMIVRTLNIPFRLMLILLIERGARNNSSKPMFYRCYLCLESKACIDSMLSWHVEYLERLYKGKIGARSTSAVCFVQGNLLPAEPTTAIAIQGSCT